MKNYTVFQIQNEEIDKQELINGLIITPYNNGICVNFNDVLSLNCIPQQGLIVRLLNYIIWYESGYFNIGISND